MKEERMEKWTSAKDAQELTKKREAYLRVARELGVYWRDGTGGLKSGWTCGKCGEPITFDMPDKVCCESSGGAK